jgi:hypothetical protein
VNRPIQIRPLTDLEAARLIENDKFNTLRPVRCRNCGNDRDFGRRVFWIGGVVKNEQNSDQVQYLISYHLKEKYGVGSVFFKSHRNRFYVDSAVCQRCGSMVIEFDIELTRDMLAAVSRITGRPVEQMMTEMEALGRKIIKP